MDKPEARAVDEVGNEVPDLGDYKEGEDEDDFDQDHMTDYFLKVSQRQQGTISLAQIVSNHFKQLQLNHMSGPSHGDRK